MQETCKEVLSALGLENDPLFKLAMELERIALSDPYFVQRKLYPNVDFYSGIVQRAIGIPTSLFTAIFALARTVGWIAQWNEMLSDPDYKIGRPRQLFTGSVTRDVPRWTSADPSALRRQTRPLWRVCFWAPGIRRLRVASSQAALAWPALSDLTGNG